MHILIARCDYDDWNWGVWLREAPGLPLSPHSMGRRLQPEVDKAIALAFATKPPMSLTFSTRTPEDTTAVFVETPADLGMIPTNTMVAILCREGRYDSPEEDHRVLATRLPGRLDLFSGKDFRFRPQVLREEIKSWFEAQHWESFGAPTRHKPNSQPLPYFKALLVRHGAAWTARSFCPPDTFPPIKDGPVLSEEQRAKFASKLGQNKSTVRRAKHQANAERFRVEAAERARLRGEVA